jgi:hypothetical protein
MCALFGSEVCRGRKESHIHFGCRYRAGRFGMHFTASL